jgi:hypothetical protein
VRLNAILPRSQSTEDKLCIIAKGDLAEYSLVLSWEFRCVANRHSIQIQYQKKSFVYEVILAASQTDKDGVDQPQTGSAPRIFPSREGQINLRLYIIYG